MFLQNSSHTTWFLHNEWPKRTKYMGKRLTPSLDVGREMHNANYKRSADKAEKDTEHADKGFLW